MAKVKKAQAAQKKREKAVNKKKAPAQKPSDKKVLRKAAKQNAEVGSGPGIVSKSQVPKRKRK